MHVIYISVTQTFTHVTVPGDALVLGPFSVYPSTSSVPPGETATVTVEFAAQGATIFSENLGIHVEDRDTNDHPQGIEFLLEGESCIPTVSREFEVAFIVSVFV